MKTTDLAQLFQKIYTEDAMSYLMNKTLYLKTDELDPNIYEIYEWELKDTWFLISHKIYGDIDLWWLLCKVNDVVNPIHFPETGTLIKVLNKEYMEFILQSIKLIEEEVDEWQLGF